MVDGYVLTWVDVFFRNFKAFLSPCVEVAFLNLGRKNRIGGAQLLRLGGVPAEVRRVQREDRLASVLVYDRVPYEV